jgi:hypothetical protein
MTATRVLRGAVVIVAIALVGIVALEVHWSMNTKNEARKAATNAAAEAAVVMVRQHDSLEARHVAEQVAANNHMRLVSFSIEPAGSVRVTVNARAKSYLLRHFGPTRSISEITVSGTSEASAPLL